MAMTNVHKDILQRNHVMFVDNLILSEELIAVLVADNILTTCMLETVQAKHTRSDRVRELMLTLSRRGDRAYAVFLRALVESRQDHLAIGLDPATANKFIEERDQEESERPRPPPQVETQPSFDIRWQPANCAGDETDTAWYDKLFSTDVKELELNVELKHIAKERQGQIVDMMKAKKVYPLEKKDGVFGRAVIINNAKYDNIDPRPGSNVDCENLKKLFDQLHFQPVVHENLTAEKMLAALKEERDIENRFEYSSFVLCILAHGRENKVYGTDGFDEYGTIDIHDITSLFNAVNCPGLLGKPKLFFIQACQGGKDMVAVSINKAKVLENIAAGRGAQSDGGSHARTVRVNHALSQSDAQPEAPSQIKISEDNRSQLHTPEVADVLVAYSTAPGYKSWRHPELGTWFVRVLNYVVLNNACEDHILDMLTQVAFIISHFKEKTGRSYAVQVPQIVSTLRKKVYFMP